MADNLVTKSLTEGAQGSKTMMNGSVIGTFLFNIVLAGSLGPIMGMINSLQLIFHLPIMSIIAPGNVVTLFNIMIPVVMFDIMESLNLWDGVFPDSEIEMEENNDILDQMKDIGYDSFNPILNLGTLFFMICVYILRVVTFFLVIYPCWRIRVIPSKVYFVIKN